MKIGLSDKQIEIVIDELKACGVLRALLFGSRAKGNWRNNSDIDIAVFGDVNIGSLLTHLDELPLPYKFDMLSYESISSKALREHIDRVGIELFPCKERETD